MICVNRLGLMHLLKHLPRSELRFCSDMYLNMPPPAQPTFTYLYIQYGYMGTWVFVVIACNFHIPIRHESIGTVSHPEYIPAIDELHEKDDMDTVSQQSGGSLRMRRTIGLLGSISMIVGAIVGKKAVNCNYNVTTTTNTMSADNTPTALQPLPSIIQLSPYSVDIYEALLVPL